MVAKAQQPFTTREITVLAEDPSVLADDGKPLLTRVKIPSEELLPGPRGARFEVIDYDATTDHFYRPHVLPRDFDPYEKASDVQKLLDDPGFHAQHVFGVAAATLFEFERSLGRNLSWGFRDRSHQLKIVPHAFREANAFYSKDDESLLFGYFSHPRKSSRTVFTCLSHDIVAHETTHAILDGLRDQLTRPSSLDQAAFHEGFADIVALLSTLRSESLIQFSVKAAGLAAHPTDRIALDKALDEIKGKSMLFGLAKEMGEATGALHRGALRRSVNIKPDPTILQRTPEAHDRGEILVAAVLAAFVEVWHARLRGKYNVVAEQTDAVAEKGATPAAGRPVKVDAWRIAEEGAKAAQHLLTMVIRAIDYLPPVHVEFRDFLMAILTADWQTCPDDSSYGYRPLLLKSFAAFGITTHKATNVPEPGTYLPFVGELAYSRGNTESMRWDRDGMFRFVWENREVLDLADDAYTRVNSVRSVWRVAPDGFIVRETVAEYYQLIKLANKRDLERHHIPVPPSVAFGARFDLVGGGTLIFDEFGTLKYHICNHLKSPKQAERLEHLAMVGQLTDRPRQPFAMAHLRAGGVRLQQSSDGVSS